MRLKRRGSTLAYVLIATVIVAVITGSLMRMVMMRYVGLKRLEDGTAGKRAAQAGLGLLASVWNESNVACSDASKAGFTCAPLSTTTPGSCNCTCAGAVVDPATNASIPLTVSVSAGATPPSCQLKIVAAAP